MRRALVIGIVSIVGLGSGAALRAQELPAAHRTPGLLGAAGQDGRQQLDLTVSGLAATDDDQVVNDLESGLGGLSARPANTYESLSLQLGYVRRFQESTIVATARSVAQHFQTLDTNIGVQRALGAGYTLHHRGLQLAIDQSVNAFPLFALQPVPGLFSTTAGELPPAVTDDAVARVFAQRSITSANVSQSLTRRLTLLASARLQNTTVGEGEARLHQDVVSAQLSYHVSRDLSLVTGYHIDRASFRLQALGTEDRVDLENIDLGVNYNKALSFSRRTTVGFSSGPVVVRNPADRTTQYTIGGEAHVNHQMRRTWQATAAYNRGVTFMDGFTAPFIGDAVAVNVGGNLKRRVELAIGGSAWMGRLAGVVITPALGDRNESLSANSRLSIAVSPTMALEIEYRYMHYRFDAPSVLLPGQPLWVDRGSVRIGFDIRLPLFS